MAIKDLINSGIGFAPGSIKFTVTHGLTPGTAVTITEGMTSLEGIASTNTSITRVLGSVWLIFRRSLSWHDPGSTRTLFCPSLQPRSLQ